MFKELIKAVEENPKDLDKLRDLIRDAEEELSSLRRFFYRKQGNKVQHYNGEWVDCDPREARGL